MKLPTSFDLDGAKAICDHLAISRMTLQRWWAKREETGLPVRKLPVNGRLVASKAGLDAWIARQVGDAGISA
ncbi:MAG: hypothetical protein K1X94_03290 [Sandaracinaceae bacterium]|nr:hypothetical protein [Sandaracinaceae bacterium]